MGRVLARRRTAVQGKRGGVVKRDPYTGLVAKISQSLEQTLKIKWSLLLALPDGVRGPPQAIPPDEVQYNATTVSLRWHAVLAGPDAPPLDRCGVGLSATALVFCGRAKPAAPSRRPPRSTSLILRPEPLEPAVEPHRCGSDAVGLEQRGPWLVGRWKDGGGGDGSGGGRAPAFLWLTLHYGDILDRVLGGTPRDPRAVVATAPYADDIDPLFGLHGHRLCVEWRSADGVACGQQYTEVGCLTKDREVLVAKAAGAPPQIEAVQQTPDPGLGPPPASKGARAAHATPEGKQRFAVATIIGERTSHQRLSRDLRVQWRAGAFDGMIDGVFVDVTLMDERDNVLWAHSALCPFEPAVGRVGAAAVDYRYDADSASTVTVCSVGGDAMLRSVVVHGDDGSATIVGSQLWLSLAMINRRFGTRYT